MLIYWWVGILLWERIMLRYMTVRLMKQGPLLWLTPIAPGIQDVERFETYINQSVKGRWPAIKLNKILRLNLERDKLEEGGSRNGVPAQTNLGILPPSVSSSSIVFSYQEGDSKEDSIEDLKDASQAEGNPPLSVREEIIKYWAGEYPDIILDVAIKAIEDTGTVDWVPASWRLPNPRD